MIALETLAYLAAAVFGLSISCAGWLVAGYLVGKQVGAAQTLAAVNKYLGGLSLATVETYSAVSAAKSEATKH